MVGEDFAFNGSWLSDFDMKMYDPEESQQFISREIEKAEISLLREIPNHYSTRYSDVLVLSLLILKNPDIYDSKNAMRLTADEVNDIRAWLESPKMPVEMRMLSVDDSLDTYYFGVFTDVQPFIISQECYGLYLTFTCNAPYGFSPYVSNTYNISSAIVTGSFYNQSSERCSYLKPIVEIISSSQFNGTEKLSIKNNSDNGNTMNITMPKGIKKLVLDCREKQITDENGNLISMSDIGLTLPQSDNYNFVSAELYLFYWIRFVHGVNDLSFIPENNKTISKVNIHVRYPRKSGGF